MPFGLGPWSWFAYPYGYPYWNWRGCRWFPWLLRWWWSGIYGSVAPYVPLPRDQEISVLEDQARLFEESLERIRKRLEELKERG